MSFGSLRSNARFRRRSVLLAYAALLMVIIGATIAFLIVIGSVAHIQFTNRIALAGIVIATSTLLLAVIAALVALQAFATATGLPDLRLQVCFDYSEKNVPVFQAFETPSGWLQTGAPAGQTLGRIWLRNLSDYSARNPAVVVRLQDMYMNVSGPENDWSLIESDVRGVTGVQWDGGPGYSIHGKSVRVLPTLDLGDLRYIPGRGRPTIRFEILAEGGYRREIVTGVRFITENQHANIAEPERTRSVGEWL
jgi:hypothetical protein